MNILSDYQAHKRDERYAGASLQAPRCAIHGVPLITGHGWVDAKTGERHNEIYQGPRCPECMAQARREANDARRLADLERSQGVE